MVTRLNFSPEDEIAEFRASPVMIPGRAMGKTSMKDNASRPKNLNRWTAKEARDPSTRAMAVAPIAALTEVRKAARISLFRQATPNHRVVRLAGGHFWPTAELNA